MKFFSKDIFSKFDQIRWKLRIWSHLLKKYFMENFIFCAVNKLGICALLRILRNLSTLYQEVLLISIKSMFQETKVRYYKLLYH